MIHIVADQKTFQAAAKALRQEADGKELRRDLTRQIRGVLKPTLAAVRAELKAMPVRADSQHARRVKAKETKGLRQTVAGKTRIWVRVSAGRTAGAGISVPATAVPRFPHAGRRLNARSWRHPVFGNRRRWVSQVGAPGWFDGPTRASQPAAKAAVADAVHDSIQRIERRGPR